MKFNPKTYYPILSDTVKRADGKGVSCVHSFTVRKKAVDYRFTLHATFDREEKMEDAVELLSRELSGHQMLRRTNVELLQSQKQDKCSYSGLFTVAFQISCP